MSVVRYSLVLFLLVTTATGFSQHFENVKTTFDGTNIIITYDLVYTDPGAPFNVAVFSSHDRYTTSLQAVKGAVGDRVLPGSGHVIIWDATQNLPYDFNDEVIVKLKGVSSALRMSPLDRTVYKKGDEVNVAWQGGAATDKVVVRLLKKGEVKKVIADNQENSYAFPWKIPKGLPAGKNYAIVVSRVGDATAASMVQQFQVKARIPLWLKVLPVAVAGAAILCQPCWEKDEDLPPPPGPPASGG